MNFISSISLILHLFSRFVNTSNIKILRLLNFIRLFINDKSCVSVQFHRYSLLTLA